MKTVGRPARVRVLIPSSRDVLFSVVAKEHGLVGIVLVLVDGICADSGVLS